MLLVTRGSISRQRFYTRGPCGRALRLVPEDAAIHIQCGHMFKEAGDLSRAEHHYDQAKQLNPDDPDLALQLGHFYKVAGRLQEAELAYRRAIDLDPDWPELADSGPCQAEAPLGR